MSDVMLHGVLNMPPEIWGDSELDKYQRHCRYVQASKTIDIYRTALEQIAALPSVRQDECSEIARKALAEGE